MGLFFNFAVNMKRVGSGDSSRTSVLKTMASPPPPPHPVVADIKESNDLYKYKIIRIDIYNSDYLFKFIYRYEKFELLI